MRLSKILKGLSHDSVNRFLLRENYTPQDLFDEVKAHLILEGGTLSGDDSVLHAFCKLQTMRVEGWIDNLYQVSRQLFIPVIRQFILENLAVSREA